MPYCSIGSNANGGLLREFHAVLSGVSAAGWFLRGLLNVVSDVDFVVGMVTTS